MTSLDIVAPEQETLLNEAIAAVARERELLADSEELAGAGSFEWDITTDRFEWSQGMYRIRGMERQGALTSTQALGGIHPDDEIRMKTLIRTAVEGDAMRISARYRIVRPDGTVRRVETNGRIERNRHGRATRAFGATLDLTDQIEALELHAAAERRLREEAEAVIEASSEAFVASDQYGRITGWNSQAEALLGWSRDEILGQSIVDTITPPAMRATRAADLETFRSTGKGHLLHQRVETSVVHRSGRELPVELAVWQTYVGAIVTFNLFMHDISDRRRVQSELASARDQSLEASRMKSEFLANMSHEIRTPMNGVIGLTELLLGSDLSGRQLEYAEMINSSGEALLTIIDQILDFSKIEAGKVELDNHKFELHEAVASVCDLLSPRAHAKGIELPLFVADDVPATVIGDAGRLRQILTNLVGNAVKFTETGQVAVAVRRGASAGMIEFSVTDTGPGIPLTEQEGLFEPFSQADASTTRRYGGTGLGLTISRQLVRLMGGDITLASTPGHGSTFEFTASLAGADGGAVAGSRTPSTMRVLVVDDNATIRQILRSYLESVDVRISTATGGEEALRVMQAAAEKQAAFQLVILDDEMPGLSGSEVAETVREDPALAGAALVILSSTRTATLAGELERCVYLNKPIRRARLHEAIALVTEVRPRPAAVPVAAQSRSSVTGARVLLAEDNRINQLVAMQMLTKRGHRVDAVPNGIVALEALSTTTYDLVLMDCQMPELDGYQTTKEIRRREADHNDARIPIVAITAHSMRGERANCLAAGMDDYLSKPFRGAQLDAILERWLVPAPALSD